MFSQAPVHFCRCVDIVTSLVVSAIGKWNMLATIEKDRVKSGLLRRQRCTETTVALFRILR